MEIWPNFFLVGAQKAGTSSIYAYLKQHSDVFLPEVKEPHFFSRVVVAPHYQPVFLRPIVRETEYLQLYRNAQGFRAVGDASVSYLWDREAPCRIHEKIPDARILIMLRDPVERAYSQYLMHVREGVETLSFYDALQANLQQQTSSWAGSRLYIETGLYAAQVRRYLDLFGPDRVHVMLFEDLKENASELVRQIAVLLEIDPAQSATIRTDEIHNPHLLHRGRAAEAIMRSHAAHMFARRFLPREARKWIRYRLILQPGPKPKPDPDAIEMLRALYEPDIRELERTLQRPLPELRIAK